MPFVPERWLNDTPPQGRPRGKGGRWRSPRADAAAARAVPPSGLRLPQAAWRARARLRALNVLESAWKDGSSSRSAREALPKPTSSGAAGSHQTRGHPLD